MKMREKILLALFMGAVVVVAGRGIVSEAFFGPIEQREARAADLRRKIEQHKLEQARVQAAQRQLANWADQSLPPDASVASTLYQNWLIDLANSSKLHDPVVTPNRVSPEGDAYLRVPFTVRAEAELGRLCDFLYSFYQTDLLHKITRIDVESSDHSDNPNLQVTVQLEALALNNAESRNTLFNTASDGQPVTKLLAQPREGYETIVDRNLFVRGYKPPRPKPNTSKRIVTAKKPPELKLDVAQHVLLVASLVSGDEREAWLYDRTSNQQIVLHEGTSFAAADMTGLVLAIGADFILFESEGMTNRLELGQSLRQVEVVAGEKPAETN